MGEKFLKILIFLLYPIGDSWPVFGIWSLLFGFSEKIDCAFRNAENEWGEGNKKTKAKKEI
jgi:hypothetical protein